MIDFMDINVDNIHNYCRFDACFKNELINYQSRIYPKNSDFFNVLIQNNLLRWSYIFYNSRIVGAIWIEKEHPTLTTGTLGIFISEKELRSKGIGSKAITMYIERNKKELNLVNVKLNVRKENIRAISCYSKCGFIPLQQFESDKGVKALVMSKSI